MLSRLLPSQSPARSFNILSDPLAFLKQTSFNRSQSNNLVPEPPSQSTQSNQSTSQNEHSHLIPKPPSSARDLWKQEETLPNPPLTTTFSRDNSPYERENLNLGERSRIKRTALDLTKRRGGDKENIKSSLSQKFGLKALKMKIDKEKAPIIQRNLKWPDNIQEPDGAYDPLAMIKRTQSPVKTRGRMETEGISAFKGFNIELMNSKLKDINRKIAHVESIKKSANKRPVIKY